MPLQESSTVYKAKVLNATRRAGLGQLDYRPFFEDDELQRQLQKLAVISSEIYANLTSEELSLAMKRIYEEVIELRQSVSGPAESWFSDVERSGPAREDLQPRWRIHLASATEAAQGRATIHAHALPTSISRGGWELLGDAWQSAFAHSEAIDAMERASFEPAAELVEEVDIESVAGKDLTLVDHDELDWIELYEAELLRHQGQWVALSASGVVAASNTMKGAFDMATQKGIETPLVIRIPAEGEAGTTLIV